MRVSQQAVKQCKHSSIELLSFSESSQLGVHNGRHVGLMIGSRFGGWGVTALSILVYLLHTGFRVVRSGGLGLSKVRWVVTQRVQSAECRVPSVGGRLQASERAGRYGGD